MKTQSFNGHLFRDPGVTKTFRTDDPARPGQQIIDRKTFFYLKNAVVDRISGYGESKGRTKDKYMTLSSQYGPFETARLTIPAQYYEVVKQELLPLIDEEDIKAGKEPLLLKEDIVFCATVEPMYSRSQSTGQRYESGGFNVKELWRVVTGTGELKPLFTIADADEEQGNGGEESATTKKF